MLNKLITVLAVLSLSIIPYHITQAVLLDGKNSTIRSEEMPRWSKIKLFNHGVDTAATMLFDYDNDGDMDIAVDNFLFLNENDAFEGHRFVSFNDTIISLPVGSATHADFDNDGYEDLVYGGGNGVMRLFINTCKKGDDSWFGMYEILDFDTLADPGFSANNYGITSSDFNSDGYVDLAVSYRVNFEMTKIALFYNVNGTAFTREDVFVETYPYERGGICEVEAGDYDNDGDMDLLYSYDTVKLCKGGIGVYSQAVLCSVCNDGEQHFGDKTVIAMRGMPILFGGKNVLLWRDIQRILGVCRVHIKMTCGDFDLDGDLDFLTGDLSGKVEFFVNDGTGHFESCDQFRNGIVGDFGYVSMGIDSADFDGDGDRDFIVCGTETDRFSDVCIYLGRNNMRGI